MERAIEILRNHAATSAEEWAKEIRNPHGCGTDLTFAESRSKHIINILEAIKKLKS